MAAAAAWTPPSASSGVLDAGAMRSRAGSSGPAVPKREFTAAHQAAMDAHTSGLAAPAPAARPTKACRADANAARTAAGWDAPDTGVEADAVGVLPGDVPALGLGDERGAGDLLVGDALGVGVGTGTDTASSCSFDTATAQSRSWLWAGLALHRVRLPDAAASARCRSRTAICAAPNGGGDAGVGGGLGRQPVRVSEARAPRLRVSRRVSTAPTLPHGTCNERAMLGGHNCVDN